MTNSKKYPRYFSVKNNCKVKGVQVTHKGVYKGTYVNNKKDGAGQYHRHSGDIYIGEWKNGKQHGTGLWINQLGESYNGAWNNGKVEGMGTLTFKSKYRLTLFHRVCPQLF